MNYFEYFLSYIRDDGRIRSRAVKNKSNQILHLIDKNSWDSGGEGHRESSRNMDLHMDSM